MNGGIRKGENTPFFVLFAAFLLFHFFMPHIRDDIVIEQGMDFTSIHPDYIRFLIGSKYEEWSSRIVINVMTLIMGKLPHIIWIIADSCMVLLAAWSVSCLTKEDISSKKQMNCFVAALFFLYPFSHMATAGWKATTVTYWWPLACGLYAMIPLVRWIRKEKILPWEYPLFVLAAFYGSNQEQMSAVLIGIYGCSLLFLYREVYKSLFPIRHISYVAESEGERHLVRRRNTVLDREGQQNGTAIWCVVAVWMISAAGFFSALFCPGNGVRVGEETALWFADYGRITLIQKLEIGISSAGFELFYKGNLCFLVLSGMLFWLVCRRYTDLEYRIIAGAPFVTCIVTGPFFFLLRESLPGLEKWKTALTVYGTITVENYTKWASYLPLLMICILVGCVLVTCYLVYEKSRKAFAMGMIFLIGYASRVVLGFSPTVWASSYRTYLFLYMAVIVLAVFAYQEGKKEEIWGIWMEKMVYIVGAVSFFSQIFGV